MATWIFQYNPDLYDMALALRRLPEMTYRTNQHASAIKAGDTVYLWESGSNPGIVAQARVQTDPQPLAQSEQGRSFWRTAADAQADKPGLKVWLRIEKVLAERIQKATLQQNPVLKTLSILQTAQGTNFPVTPEQAAGLSQLVANIPDSFTPGADSPELEKEFNTAMLNLYQQSVSAINYKPTYLLQMVNEHGGRQAARTLLAKDEPTSGLTTLWEKGRLDLSVEALVLKPEFAALFTAEERQKARRYLQEFNFSAPWDKADNSPAIDSGSNGYTPAAPLLERLQNVTQMSADDGQEYLAAQNGNVLVKEQPVSTSELTREKILQTMRVYDETIRNPANEFDQPRKGYTYAFTYQQKYYPVRKIMVMATNNNDLNTDQARNALVKFGFELVTRPDSTVEPEWPQLDGPAFVVIYKREGDGQQKGKSYSFSKKAAGSPGKLDEALRAYQAGGPTVYLIMYEPTPEYSFIAWARVSQISGDYQTGYKLDLEYHPFEPPLQLKANARSLMNEIEWLKGGLLLAFNYKSIRQITPQDFETIMAAARKNLSLTDAAYAVLAGSSGQPLSLDEIREAIDSEGLYKDTYNSQILDSGMLRDDRFTKLGSVWMLSSPPAPESQLPVAWPNLANYRDFVQVLENRFYTQEELLAQALEYGEGFNPLVDSLTLAKNLCHFRLMQEKEKEDGAAYEVPEYASGDHPNSPTDQAAALRLMALGLLLPRETGTEDYQIPSLAVLRRWRLNPNSDWQAAEAFAPELAQDGPKLMGWYGEAGLVEIEGGRWRVVAGEPTPVAEQAPVSRMYNRFLAALLAERDGTGHKLPVIEGDFALRALGEADLNERLQELGRELLIDEMVVRRIYRSLVAGRHVVLSGPPGTGKTELAKRLPTLLWRERLEADRVTLGLADEPVKAETFVRHGYKPVIVTATEDWSVRDVVGGISPRLQSGANGQGLSYHIQYGHLTRTILMNYQATSDLNAVPSRSEYKEKDIDQDNKDNPNKDSDKRYSGAWLVIDEFTRAPVDAAFGSLLTTLGGGVPRLSIPAADGSEDHLILPRDFRIIGTLNSFDRHFLNQISEALKRRFDFIDVLPPLPAEAAYEQGIALKNAIRKLETNGLTRDGLIRHDPQTGTYEVKGFVRIDWSADSKGILRPIHRPLDQQAGQVFESFWRIFQAIRVFRQLGTAQAEAVYLNLLTGKIAAGMAWPVALDAALADSLADQLQVLTRDEQKILLAYLKLSEGSEAFLVELKSILNLLPPTRRTSLLKMLAEAHQLRAAGGTTERLKTGENDVPQLTTAQLDVIFGPPKSLALPAPSDSIFYNRVSNLLGERGL